jgi:hypothetical protein
MKIKVILVGNGDIGNWGKGGVAQWAVGFQARDQEGWGFATIDKEPLFQVRGFSFHT